LSTFLGAVLGFLVLSAGGALPALALARGRMVAIPLVPLSGAIVASLSVTAMTAVGGSLASWFTILSVLGAAVVLFWWWARPDARPWKVHGGPVRAPSVLGAFIVCAVAACAFGLSRLEAPVIGYDARTTWLVHPVWYLAGHATTVAALRNPALMFSHPTYPPLVGGSIAMTWLVAGVSTARLGTVVIAVLGALAILAAASAVMEAARRLAVLDGDRRRRLSILGFGAVIGVLFIMVAVGVARDSLTNGYADVLWSAAAVGAVGYGLVLPCEPAGLGAAALLAVVAGTTKLEGSLTAAVIIGLIAARLICQERRSERPRSWLPVCALAIGSWLVIGAWPVSLRLVGALSNRATGGAREGSDAFRFHVSVVGAWTNLHIVALAVAVAVVGAMCLRRVRQRAGLGTDLWAWAALASEVVIVLYAYVTGPGIIHTWVDTSIQRTMIFPELEAWWLMAIWAVVALSELRVTAGTGPTERAEPSNVEVVSAV
jgi:hypothetical protein